MIGIFFRLLFRRSSFLLAWFGQFRCYSSHRIPFTCVWLMCLSRATSFSVLNCGKIMRIWSRCSESLCCCSRYEFDMKIVFFKCVSLQLVFPFGIIGVSYTRIWVFLHCRKSLVTERESSPVIKRRRRLLRLLITMVVLFAFFLLPFTTLNLLRDFGFRENMKQYFSFLFLLFHLMSMVGTAVNPILYAWNNQAFRQAVKCFLKFLTTQVKLEP